MAATRRKCFIECESAFIKTRQPLPDIAITPLEWKPDKDVSIIHDGLYARVLECECQRLISQNNIATPPNSTEITVKSDLSAEET